MRYRLFFLLRMLYSFGFLCYMPFVILRLVWRSRNDPAYLQAWNERFGLANLKNQHGIWIHAVSMGESITAIPLIKQLRQRYPELPITVTTMTVTGAKQIKKSMGDQIHHYYIPYDFYWMQKRLINCLKPTLLIIMETELWPNLLSAAKAAKLPVLLANGRLSEKSAKEYGRIGLVTRCMLSSITQIAVQEKAHMDRFIRLGACANRIQVTGSMKYDITIADHIRTEAQQFRQYVKNRSVWIAASTHEGEEIQILAAYRRVKEAVPNALLILVPRHPERFNSVVNLVKKTEYVVMRRTQLKDTKTSVFEYDIVIGDTMGELLMLYASSDVAFVGGSLIEHGGHNPLEPAALGLPVIMGPHVYNFASITQTLNVAKALITVNDERTLAQQVISWLNSPEQVREVGNRGYSVVVKNRGALQKHLDLIDELLSREKISPLSEADLC